MSLSTVDPTAFASRIRAAHALLLPHVRLTPFDRSGPLSVRLGGEVRLKGEHLQHTGSFKVRGALHKVLSLTPEARTAGVVAASSGNHGAGVAWACELAGLSAVIYVPEHASPAKVAMIKSHGAEVRHFGVDGLDTEEHARANAVREGRCYISPYNDWEVMYGQGTVAVEMVEQLKGEALDAVIVAVGGGGLIGGIAGYLKAVMPSVRIIGALPANSPVMAESVSAGRVVVRESLQTLSDGTAGGIERDTITFPVCQALVDEWVLVHEDEIASAMRRFIDEHHQLVEGAAGVALAALERRAGEGATTGLHGARVGVVLCGANIAMARLREVLGGTPTHDSLRREDDRSGPAAL